MGYWAKPLQKAHRKENTKCNCPALSTVSRYNNIRDIIADMHINT